MVYHFSVNKMFFKRSLVSAAGEPTLKEALKRVIPQRKEKFLELKKNHANKQLGHNSVGSIIGGMRGIPALYWESSKVDPHKGVTFHGLTIEECQNKLPHAKLDGKLSEFLPESMFWFLLTGQVPSQSQVDNLSKTLMQNAMLPGYVCKMLDVLPAGMHPMTQLSIGVSALNKESKFAKAYEKGIPKQDYWEYVFDDVLNLIAKLPALIGKVYQNSYMSGHVTGAPGGMLGEIDVNKDWSYNLASALGYTSGNSANIHNFDEGTSADFVNLVRLYCALHADHEGGNVSSHATHLVGSALCDPYLSYSAGIQGLAGPLHGLAAQEVVRFIIAMKRSLGLTDHDVSGLNNPAFDDKITGYLWSVLKSGRVIPGYGHAVLRKPDPRFNAMLKFGLNRPSISENDVNFNLVHKLSQIAPGVLIKHGKTKNPFPNVDSSSGVLFYHYGLRETLFFTVIFAGSRAFGPLNQLIWDRILGLPIERPTSLTLQGILDTAKKSN